MHTHSCTYASWTHSDKCLQCGPWSRAVEKTKVGLDYFLIQHSGRPSTSTASHKQDYCRRRRPWLWIHDVDVGQRRASAIDPVVVGGRARVTALFHPFFSKTMMPCHASLQQGPQFLLTVCMQCSQVVRSAVASQLDLYSPVLSELQVFASTNLPVAR